MLTLVHANPAAIDNGVFKVDRKFRTGVQNYAGRSIPLTTIHPAMVPDQPIMDLIEVPCSEFSYRVITVKTDRCGGTSSF